jgi:DNA-binding transcriptional LysR family regulator
MRHDLVTLSLFVAVAECGNLTRAAEREHLAVSAISKRIAELEALVGIELLQRLPRGVVLTPAGQSLLRHARLMLQQLDQLESELAEYAGGVKGHVRLHAVASALVQFLPADLEGFVARYPGVRLSLEERTGPAVLQAVADGSADLGIVSTQWPLQGLASYPYRSDRLMLGVPPGHPLARRKSVRFARALEHPFVGPHADSSIAKLMTEAARACGKPLDQRIQASSFDAMCRLVETGLGITLLPGGVLAPQAAAGRLCVVPLNEPWAQRDLVIIVRHADAAGAITRSLIDHLQRAGAAPSGQ